MRTEFVHGYGQRSTAAVTSPLPLTRSAAASDRKVVHVTAAGDRYRSR